MAGSGNVRLRGRWPSAVTTFALLAVATAVAALILLRGPGSGEEASAPPSLQSPLESGPAESTAPEASISPSPTAAVATSPPAIIDRPGVPPALYDRYWSVSWGIVGSVGTTAYYKLPEGEQLLAAADGFVASYVWLGDGRSPTRIIIRDFGTLEPRRTVETDTWVRQGTIVNGVLFWAGMKAMDTSDAPPLDGGIAAMDLQSNGSPTSVVPPGEDLTPLMGETTVERLPFQVSPTGRTVASTIAGGSGYRTDVIAADSLAPRAVLDESVVGLTDDVAIARRGAPITTGPVVIAAVDIDSGKTKWIYPTDDETGISTFRQPFVHGDRVVLTIHAIRQGADRQLLISIDTRSGDVQQYLSQSDEESWLYIVPELSTGDQLALAKASFEDALSDEGHVGISLFDSADRSLERNVFRIDLP